MKKLLNFTWVLAVVSTIILVSCSDKSDEPQPSAQNRFDVLKNYLNSQNMDLDDILTDWITTAEDVYTVMTDVDPLNDYFIIDIRKEEDYSAGHMEWAVNSTLGGILETAQDAGGKPIIVVCYSGQAAGHGVVALRLSGYTDAKVMKWGMSSWNSATAGPWNSHTGDAAIGDGNWINPPGSIQGNTAHNTPEVNYTTTDGSEILKDQILILLSGGFSGVSGVDVLANPADYFVNNFWEVADIEQYGNIKDACRIKPLTLGTGEYVYLDPNAKVVTYCWTGHSSSIVTAYLKVIGYDSYSLTYGTNSMIYTNLESNKWGPTQIMEYPLTQ
ncbi:MAG: hypothetical protein H8D45_11165 [Bacteroidetes bacterium]|nr:hypothetical protein [Bacteroidota bacterium]MBL7105514.1 hypothetical protein [Bacteroidales bacterium]